MSEAWRRKVHDVNPWTKAIVPPSLQSIVPEVNTVKVDQFDTKLCYFLLMSCTHNEAAAGIERTVKQSGKWSPSLGGTPRNLPQLVTMLRLLYILILRKNLYFANRRRLTEQYFVAFTAPQYRNTGTDSTPKYRNGIPRGRRSRIFRITKR